MKPDKIGLEQLKQTSAGAAKGADWKLVGVIGGIILILGVIAAAMVVIPMINSGRREAKRVECAANLRMIFAASQIYAQLNKDMMPPNAEAFASYISSNDTWICPECGNVSGGGAGPAASSYIYVGGSLGKYVHRIHNASKVVLAYEPLSNHGGTGFNVVYLDGHAQWIPAERAEVVMREIEAQSSKLSSTH